MENNKNKKSVKLQEDMLNFCDFIQVFVFTRNHHLKATGQPDFSFENESSMCTVIAVMTNNYGCMKSVNGKSGWATLQNSY